MLLWRCSNFCQCRRAPMRTGSSAFSSVQRRRSELLLGEEDGDVKAAEDRMWSQCSLQLCVSAEKRRSCNLQPSPHHPALGLHLRPTRSRCWRLSKHLPRPPFPCQLKLKTDHVFSTFIRQTTNSSWSKAESRSWSYDVIKSSITVIFLTWYWEMLIVLKC